MGKGSLLGLPKHITDDSNQITTNNNNEKHTVNIVLQL